MNSLALEWSLHFGENRKVPEGQSLNRMAVSSEYSFCPKQTKDSKTRKTKIAQKREERRKNLSLRYDYLGHLEEVTESD